MTSEHLIRQAASSQHSLHPVRLVVTGHTADGHSTIITDGPSPNSWASQDVVGFGAIVPWLTTPPGISNEGNEDAAPADAAVPMYPEVGGTVFRIASFPPDARYADGGAESLFDDIGGEHARDAAGAEDDSRHFWFHRTDSLDYAIVLEGEIWLLTDKDEALLRPGDVVIQRGTSHSWSNRTDRTCRMAFILLGAPPLSGSRSA